MKLLYTPAAIPTLYPVIMRENSYWLLTGPQGGDVARLALADSPSQPVIAALNSLRSRFRETIRVEDLAALAGMSVSVFHRRFKALTALTPLQYQKQLRLLEARRLMLSHTVNVETAAFEVGYESPSQFSREYARLFGAPPRRDLGRLRGRLSIAPPGPNTGYGWPRTTSLVTRSPVTAVSDQGRPTWKGGTRLQ